MLNRISSMGGGSMTSVRNRRAHRKTKHKIVRIAVVFIIIGVIAFASIEVSRALKTKQYANELLAEVRPMMQDKPYIDIISVDNFDKVNRNIKFRLNESFNKLSSEERHLFLRDEIYSPIAEFYYLWSLKLPDNSLLFSYALPTSLYIQVIAYSGNQVYKYGKFSNSRFPNGDHYIDFDEVFIDSDGKTYEYANDQEKAEEYARIQKEWNRGSNKSNEVIKDSKNTQRHSSDALQCSNCGRYYEPGDIAGNFWNISVSSFCLNCYEIYKLERYIQENYN